MVAPARVVRHADPLVGRHRPWTSGPTVLALRPGSGRYLLSALPVALSTPCGNPKGVVGGRRAASLAPRAQPEIIRLAESLAVETASRTRVERESGQRVVRQQLPDGPHATRQVHDGGLQFALARGEAGEEKRLLPRIERGDKLREGVDGLHCGNGSGKVTGRVAGQARRRTLYQ
jgi:hypothetical protein